MTISGLARILSDAHSHYRVDSINADNCRQPEVAATIADILPRGSSEFTLLPPGTSAEGRPLPIIRFGHGPKPVLFWSQMHGDESTATLALMDIFSFFARDGLARVGMAGLPERCSLYFIPILNPDGAERRTRQTAEGIDMNRDARRFATPEARFLRQTHRLIRPSVGFNLHDQELSTVGNSSALTAIALLAPAADVRRTVNATRKRAMQVASVMVRSLEPLAKGRLASYNDAFEPRAFGDMMQSWGTSTVLVESGHWINDPGKKAVRRLNFVGLLSAIRSIAAGSYLREGLSAYQTLEPNGKRAYDIIVRGAMIGPTGKSGKRMDVGFQLERAKEGKGLIARVRELGDLRGLGALLSFPGRKVKLDMRVVGVDVAFSLTRLGRILRAKIPLR